MHSERESLPCLRKPQGNFDPVHSTFVVLHTHYHSNQGERHGGSASVTATLGKPQKRKGCANEKMSAGGRASHLLPHSWHACPSLGPPLATAAPHAHLPALAPLHITNSRSPHRNVCVGRLKDDATTPQGAHSHPQHSAPTQALQQRATSRRVIRLCRLSLVPRTRQGVLLGTTALMQLAGFAAPQGLTWVTLGSTPWQMTSMATGHQVHQVHALEQRRREEALLAITAVQHQPVALTAAPAASSKPHRNSTSAPGTNGGVSKVQAPRMSRWRRDKCRMGNLEQQVMEKRAEEQAAAQDNYRLKMRAEALEHAVAVHELQMAMLNRNMTCPSTEARNQLVRRNIGHSDSPGTRYCIRAFP